MNSKAKPWRRKLARGRNLFLQNLKAPNLIISEIAGEEKIFITWILFKVKRTFQGMYDGDFYFFENGFFYWLSLNCSVIARSDPQCGCLGKLFSLLALH